MAWALSTALFDIYDIGWVMRLGNLLQEWKVLSGCLWSHLLFLYEVLNGLEHVDILTYNTQILK